MRMVLLISFGMTTRPKSSMRRTIPVAFIVSNLSVEWIELTLNLLFDTERKIYWKKSSEAKTAGKLRSYLLGQEGRFETLLRISMAFGEMGSSISSTEAIRSTRYVEVSLWREL